MCLLITGLALSFLGSFVVTSCMVKTRGQILGVSRQIIPVMKDRSGEDLETAADKALLSMPKIKQQIRQSRIAIIGLGLLTVGFLLQLIGVVISEVSVM